MATKAFTLKFGKSGYYHSTTGIKSIAEDWSKQRGGKVVGLNKSQYKKVYGNHDWGYD